MRAVSERNDNEYVLLESEKIKVKEKQPEKKPKSKPEPKMKSEPAHDNSSANETSRLFKTQNRNFETFSTATSTIIVKQRSASAPVTPIKTALPALPPHVLAAIQKRNENLAQLNKALLKNAKAGNFLEVRALIKGGANPLHLDEQGKSAIVLAASAGKSAVVEELLFALAVPVSTKRPSLYHQRQQDDAQSFAENGKTKPIGDKEKWKHAKEFANHKYGRMMNPKARDELQKAVKKAIEFGHAHTLKILMAHGSESKVRCGDDGRRPLMIAAQYGHLHIVKLLIAYGMDLNKTDCNGDTALMIATRNGYDLVADELIQHGADASIKNKTGESMAMILLDRAEARLDDLIKNTAPKPAQRHKQKGREADSE